MGALQSVAVGVKIIALGVSAVALWLILPLYRNQKTETTKTALTTGVINLFAQLVELSLHVDAFAAWVKYVEVVSVCALIVSFALLMHGTHLRITLLGAAMPKLAAFSNKLAILVYGVSLVSVALTIANVTWLQPPILLTTIFGAALATVCFLSDVVFSWKMLQTAAEIFGQPKHRAVMEDILSFWHRLLITLVVTDACAVTAYILGNLNDNDMYLTLTGRSFAAFHVGLSLCTMRVFGQLWNLRLIEQW